ncbi:hypothetical protein LCGC14_0686310 [marine sediment metagenome]|uniref:Uncharacterized protein n=1 Tax=marine sediment metagenome TaxID=412755 RepID=A0A0F9QRM6_9ZZZZ
MTAPRVGASPTGQTHYLDDEGLPLCNVRVSDALTVSAVWAEPQRQRCRTKYAKPCPFCGEEPTFFEPAETGDPGSLWCPNCDASGPTRDGHRTHTWTDIYGKEHSQKQAVHHENRLHVFNAWNRRASFPTLSETGD